MVLISWTINNVISSDALAAPYCIIVFCNPSILTSLFLKNSYVALVSYQLLLCFGILAPGWLLTLLRIVTKRSLRRTSPKSKCGKSLTVILCISIVYVKEPQYFY